LSLLVDILLVVVLLASSSFLAWSAPQDRPQAVLQFYVAFIEGADCPRLFELRNEAKRQGADNAQQKMMNEKLLSVGCIGDTSKRVPIGPPNTGNFTVKEYRIYREAMSTPMSVSEAENLGKIAKKYKLSVPDVRKLIDKVQRNLFENKWMNGTPEMQIRHALDWKGEAP
jgi:hypothetical protein